MMIGVSMAQATLVFVPNEATDSIIKFDIEAGTYMGMFGTGFLNGVTIGGVEQNPTDGYVYASMRVNAGSNSGLILRFDPYTGAYAGNLGTGFLNNPKEMAFASDGKLYVVDQTSSGEHAVLRFDPATGAYGGILGLGFIGTTGRCSIAANQSKLYVTRGGAGQGAYVVFDALTGSYEGLFANGFCPNPVGIDFRPNGNLIVGSSDNQTSMRFNLPANVYAGLFANGYGQQVKGLATYGSDKAIVRILTYGSTGEAILRFDVPTGTYQGILAVNYGISGFDMAAEKPACISGNLTLQNWSGGNVIPTYEILDDNDNVVQSGTLDPTTGGPFKVCITERGTYKLAIKASHWLRKLVSNVVVGRTGPSGVNFSLINGDVNNDNEVGPADFTLLSAAFGTFLGDPGYNAEADLNGDEEVGPADFTILSASFGEIGD